MHEDIAGSRSSSQMVNYSMAQLSSLPRIPYVHVHHQLISLSSVQYDGKYVVSGAYDYLVKVWDPEDGSCLHTLQGHTNRVYSLQVSVGRKTIWCIKTHGGSCS